MRIAGEVEVNLKSEVSSLNASIYFNNGMRTGTLELMENSSEAQYADRLYGISNKRYKRALGRVNPYRLHIRHLIKGTCLDLGAGFGRNLGYLNDSRNVGVEPNLALRKIAETLGHNVLAREHLFESFSHQHFENLLISHVLEHLPTQDHHAFLQEYLPFLKVGGKVVILIPQRAGFKQDSDHKYFWTPALMSKYLHENKLSVVRIGSFPLPTWFGQIFVYNEWFIIAEKSDATERR